MTHFNMRLVFVPIMLEYYLAGHWTPLGNMSDGQDLCHRSLFTHVVISGTLRWSPSILGLGCGSS